MFHGSRIHDVMCGWSHARHHGSAASLCFSPRKGRITPSAPERSPMMKRIATTLALLALCAAPALAANAVRISQVYTGGGASTGSPTYNVDYVEIYNSGNVAVNIGSWTIEYGSATGNWGSSAANQFAFPVGTTIQPCQYMLVSLGTPSSAGGPLPISADFTGTLSMGATAGK